MEGLRLLAGFVLFFLSMGLFQELSRNLIIYKREKGEDISWGFVASLITFFMSLPPFAIVTILYSIISLYKMGWDVKLCIWMPIEFRTPQGNKNKKGSSLRLRQKDGVAENKPDEEPKKEDDSKK